MYLRSDQPLPSSPGALAGKTVGILKGVCLEDFIENNYPEINVVRYADCRNLIEALLNNKLSAVLADAPGMSQFLNGAGWQGLVQQAPITLPSINVQAGVLPKHAALVNLIDQGFHDISVFALADLEKRWLINPHDRTLQASNAGSVVELTPGEREFIAKHPSIRLASTPNWPPFEMDENGAYAGIAADFIRMAATKAGLEIEAVFDPKWKAQVQKLQNHELDVAPGLNETDERKEYLVFTEPYITYYSAIFTRNDRSDIQSLDDLKGKTVALEKGYAVAKTIARDHPEIIVKQVDTSLDAIQAVSLGKADAYIGNQLVASYLLKKFTIINMHMVDLFQVNLPGQLRFGVRKDQPILRDILQKGLNAINQEERDAILDTYIDIEAGFKQTVFALTDAQWDWLKTIKTITCGVAPAWAPLEFVSQEKGYQGVASEYVALAQDKLKIPFKPVPGLSRSEALERAVQGVIDVLPCVAPAGKLQNDLLFTTPYLSYPIVLFSQSDAPLIGGLSDASKAGIAVLNEPYLQELLSQKAPEARIVVYDTIVDAMEALSLGKVEYCFNDMASGAYAIESLGLKNIKVAASTEYKLSLAMGVRKDLPELVPILNQVLATIDKKEAGEMKSKWMAIHFEHGLDIWTVLKWGGPIAAGLTLIIVIIVVWNRRLDREISARKKAQAELAAAYGEIQSSINYASRIQQAILPDQSLLAAEIPDHFILWKPRDVVGGDIYWFRNWGTGLLFILADCTGHGVPGAFMTLISSGALDRALQEISPGDAAAVISRMHQLIQLTLNQNADANTGKDGSDDGLELGVCHFDPQKRILTYAGARFPLFLAQDGAISVIQGDKKGVGYRGTPFNCTWTNQQVTILPGTRFYLATDGMLDQIGGPKRRGFGKKRFIRLLESLQNLPVQEHGEKIYSSLEAYQDTEARRDDVAVIGFEL